MVHLVNDIFWSAPRPVGKSLLVTAFDEPADSAVTIVGEHQGLNEYRLQQYRKDDTMLLPIVRNCALAGARAHADRLYGLWT